MITVINQSGTQIDFNPAVAFMDADIREQIASGIAPCTEQEFFAAYEAAHEAKYGEEWELSKANPIY